MRGGRPRQVHRLPCGLKIANVVEFGSGKPVTVRGVPMVVYIGRRTPRIAMFVGIFTAAILVHSVVLAASDDIPTELAFIEGVIGDEQEAVDSVRRFDRAQQALAAWDLDTARTHGANGEVEDADRHTALAQHRITLIDQAYRLILKHYTENARALTYYGELLYDRLGDPATAINNWRKATALDRSLSAPHNNLGLHYCHTGDYRMGLRELDRALELDEDHADYHFNIAQIYLVNGPQVENIRGWDKKRIYREAMKHSKNAAVLAPDDYDLQQDYAVNFFAAENYGVTADWKDAAEAWSVARAKARSEVEEFYTWLNEARVWIERGDERRAKPCLEEALVLVPDSVIVSGLLEKIQKKGD